MTSRLVSLHYSMLFIQKQQNLFIRPKKHIVTGRHTDWEAQHYIVNITINEGMRHCRLVLRRYWMR